MSINSIVMDLGYNGKRKRPSESVKGERDVCEQLTPYEVLGGVRSNRPIYLPIENVCEQSTLYKV